MNWQSPEGFSGRENVLMLRFWGASQVAEGQKNPPANAQDAGSVPGSGKPLGEGNDTPLLYSSLGKPMDRGAWWTTVHGAVESWTQLSE